MLSKGRERQYMNPGHWIGMSEPNLWVPSNEQPELSEQIRPNLYKNRPLRRFFSNQLNWESFRSKLFAWFSNQMKRRLYLRVVVFKFSGKLRGALKAATTTITPSWTVCRRCNFEREAGRAIKDKLVLFLPDFEVRRLIVESKKML